MPEKYTTFYPAKRMYPDGKVEDTKVLLARECPIKLFLDGKIFTTLFSSPLELRELAVGHLITEGILTFDQIENVTVEKDEVYVKTQKQKKKEKQYSQAKELNLEVFVGPDTIFGLEALFAATNYLESETYRLTRGTHLAALIDQKGELKVQIIDVGRHNAVDKVVGAAFFRGFDISKLYMLSTGRQPAYMVTKAARAGIPLIVTKAMPFDSGVEAAKKANVCLIGQLRKESLLVFANEWRVDFDKN
jgi:FdhD protein